MNIEELVSLMKKGKVSNVCQDVVYFNSVKIGRIERPSSEEEVMPENQVEDVLSDIACRSGISPDQIDSLIIRPFCDIPKNFFVENNKVFEIVEMGNFEDVNKGHDQASIDMARMQGRRSIFLGGMDLFLHQISDSITPPYSEKSIGCYHLQNYTLFWLGYTMSYGLISEKGNIFRFAPFRAGVKVYRDGEGRFACDYKRSPIVVDKYSHPFLPFNNLALQTICIGGANSREALKIKMKDMPISTQIRELLTTGIDTLILTYDPEKISSREQIPHNRLEKIDDRGLLFFKNEFDAYLKDFNRVDLRITNPDRRKR